MTAPDAGVVTRNVRRGYESIPREVLQDKRLTFRARGLLSYLLSLPPGWRTSATRLARELDLPATTKAKEGRDAIETALRELVVVGYLGRERVQADDGTWGWIWIYGDDPTEVAAAVAEEAAKRVRLVADTG